MRKRMRVGRATDGLMGGRSRKPRYYAEIDDEDGDSVVAKIMTHDEKNPKHAEKMRKGLRKPIRNFSSNSVIDRSLYVEKDDKRPIRTNELDFEKNKFSFNEEQSRSIRRFIFSGAENRQRYCGWKMKKKKK